MDFRGLKTLTFRIYSGGVGYNMQVGCGRVFRRLSGLGWVFLCDCCMCSLGV